MKTTTLLIILIIAAALHSCYYDNEEELYPATIGSCDTTAVTYTGKIEEIITLNCAISGCHQGSSPSGGLFLETYQQTQAIAENGKLLDRVVILENMPPTGALSACDQKAIEDWVAAGAPN